MFKSGQLHGHDNDSNIVVCLKQDVIATFSTMAVSNGQTVNTIPLTPLPTKTNFRTTSVRRKDLNLNLLIFLFRTYHI